MRYKHISDSLFIKNRQKLAKKIEKKAVAIVNANDEMPRSGDQHHSYHQNPDLYYLTGIAQEKTLLLLCPDFPDESMREILFIIRPNKMLEIWEGHKLTIEEAQEISGIKTVKYIDQFDSVSRTIILENESIYLNMNEYAKFTSEVPVKDVRFINEMKEIYPLHQFRRLSPHITSLRFNKEFEEIEILKKAGDVTGKAFERVLKFTKPGVMEYEVEAEITHEFIRSGANGHGYAPIVASGKSACSLHYITNDLECKDGDLLLMDFGAEYANYSADISRTIPVNGKFTKRQRELYDACLRVFRKSIDMLRPGITYKEYNQKVGKLWEEEHITLGLYTREDLEKQDPADPLFFNYQPHNISHPIGLDVHDVGYSMNKPLEAGMVVTCEPGIYVPDENIGIRLENDILITEDGPVDLTAQIPIEPDEIEKLMNI